MWAWYARCATCCASRRRCAPGMKVRTLMPLRPGPPRGHGGYWGQAPLAGGLLSMLGTLLELALLVGLIWLLLRWLLPYLRPRINAWFGLTPTMPSAFEILRQRYAAGQIDGWTFEHMWERL